MLFEVDALFELVEVVPQSPSLRAVRVKKLRDVPHPGGGAGRLGRPAGQVGKTSVRWSQPAQRNRYGQPAPPAWALDGSAQAPNGTATSPTARRACSKTSSCSAAHRTRLPRVELQAVTGSMASPTVNFFRAKLT